jgi:hypothetical protein
VQRDSCLLTRKRISEGIDVPPRQVLCEGEQGLLRPGVSRRSSTWLGSAHLGEVLAVLIAVKGVTSRPQILLNDLLGRGPSRGHKGSTAAGTT